MSPSIKSANLVGMGSRILEVERLLAMDTLDDTRIIGLWGMGGVGKTTLAEACYERITSSNKGIKHIFIRNINENYEKHHGMEEIVQNLYSRLLNESNIVCGDLDITYRRARLSRLKVFIVLDNVETLLQLEQLALGDVFNFTKVFAIGSRIIVTTRNNKVLHNAMAKIYDVECLNDEESTCLFSLHAFKQDDPHDNWRDESCLATSYCRGNPLALKILGGALFGEDKHYWQSFLSGLKQTGKPEIHNILRKSYDKLGAEEKKIFLDVACLLHEISRSQLIEEKIVVHDLLKEMAWNIVNEEPKLHKRSRLADADDIHKLLTTREEADAFDGMNSLTFLKIWSDDPWNYYKIHLPYGGLNSLPDGLRFLQWDEYPAKSLPSKFCPQHLVHLTIRQSPIRRCWEGYDQLVNLMVLDLSYCRNLIAIPNISRSSNLEVLLLDGCESLVEVPSYVQYLTKLITLELRDCKNLKRLPPKLDSKLLKYVRMSSCLKVTHCPEMNSRELEELYLYKTSLVELPNAIYNVKKDGDLSLYGKNITKFSAVTTSLMEYKLCHTSIREMDYHHHQASSDLVLPRFRGLRLYENSQLKSLPESVWNMVSDRLEINGSPLIESLPEVSEPVNGLTDLDIRNCGGLKSLPSNLGNIKSLTKLYLSNTGITSLPSSIQELQQLTEVNLSYCRSLVSVPSGIHKLPKLSSLCLKGCVSIRSLPELPPNLKKLNVGGCKSLQALPSNTGKLLHLVFLLFDDCPQLDQNLPAELVADFLAHAASLVSSYRQVYSSRSELPDWFTYKSENPKMAEDCIVKVELPLLKHSHQPMLKAFAFGVVYKSSTQHIHIECKREVGTTTVASWSFKIWGEYVKESLSENLWLAFDNNLLGNSHCKGEGDEAWYVKYAGLTVSFKFYISEKVKIKSCGVCLVY
ncbi:Disease resistance-like protein DSC1 [Linum perenne]